MNALPWPGRLRLALLAVPFYLPALLRLLEQGRANPAGLLSDLAAGTLCLSLVLLLPLLLRVILLVLWAGFQVSAREMLAAVQRFPTWQDLHYVTDPTFLANTGEGLQLAAPCFAGLMFLAVLAALLAGGVRVAPRSLLLGFAIGVSLLAGQGLANREAFDAPVAARFNALHWFLQDAASIPLRGRYLEPLPPPALFSRADLDGTRLIGRGRAKNVLIVTLEGIHGGYHPDIRRAMGVGDADLQTMSALTAQTTGAMLVPDFVTHSHQTIRGLYALLCGDVAKLSTDTPKGLQIIGDPRAGLCLPAQLAQAGWRTHFLQGAGLAFMDKDRIMPAIGFEQVHGSEWFTARDQIPFLWGASDPAFFEGARQYVRQLRAGEAPWMLTLLTVGTHQPYGVTDEIAGRYPDRLVAAVATLDQAVAEFLAAIRADGVLEDTLVIVTTDESHGLAQTDWVSSWGINLVLAPEQAQLPRIKRGTYGLIDMQTSIMDYFELPIPDRVGGRSLFRDYSDGRDIAAYTGGVLRWQTPDDKRYECTHAEGCRVCAGAGILGPRPAQCRRAGREAAMQLFRMAYALDHLYDADGGERVMQFASGQLRTLPEKLQNEWTDNVIGAQYLDFPEDARVHVSIRLSAPPDNGSEVQMRLTLRAWEQEVADIDYPPFPVLGAGESTALEFAFETERKMQSFSFHLFGEGVRSRIRIDEFTVRVTPKSS